MYCPSCGNEITVELKYCNRCGANLSLPATTATVVAPPVKLTVPSIVLGLTNTCGLGIIIAGAGQMALLGVHPTAIVFLVLFSAATLFGCISMMIRFWTRLITLQRELPTQPSRPALVERPTFSHVPPRLEPVPSVTENTTR